MNKNEMKTITDHIKYIRLVEKMIIDSPNLYISFKGEIYTYKYKILDYMCKLKGKVHIQQNYPDLYHRSDLINFENADEQFKEGVEFIELCNNIINKGDNNGY